jgi:hypothetical protein
MIYAFSRTLFQRAMIYLANLSVSRAAVLSNQLGRHSIARTDLSCPAQDLAFQKNLKGRVDASIWLSHYRWARLQKTIAITEYVLSISFRV